jgi:hypothetical protein
MVNTKSTLVSLVLATAILVTGVVDATAIPAFARKYNLSCTTCHAPMPRLKEFGDEFAGSGFRMAASEEPVRAYRDTGDPLLTLQRELPLAVRLDAFAVYESGDDTDFADLQTPWGMKILSGGSVAPKVGYYFYFYLAERGEVAGIEDAYLHFDDLGGSGIDVMVGQFQLCDPMMKRELRLTYEDYEVYRVRPGGSQANLTYDRGVLVAYDHPVGLGFVGQIVNGNGKGAADEAGRFDADADKGYAARVVFARGPVTVGGFGYWTQEELVDTEVSLDNEVEILGPDLHVAFGERAALSAQFLRRTDTHPIEDTRDVRTDGWVAELTVQPGGPDAKDSLVLLYNRLESDLADLELQTWTLSWSHLHRRNLRMVAEYTYDTEREQSRAAVGFTSAF